MQAPKTIKSLYANDFDFQLRFVIARIQGEITAECGKAMYYLDKKIELLLKQKV